MHAHTVAMGAYVHMHVRVGMAKPTGCHGLTLLFATAGCMSYGDKKLVGLTHVATCGRGLRGMRHVHACVV